MPYVTPGSDIVSIIDTPPTPLVRLAPGGEYLALVHYESHPPVTMLANPYRLTRCSAAGGDCAG